MENAVEALKIAFGVIMFVLALSLSISCFSQARIAIDATITTKDRETHYVYVENSPNTNRIVGVEAIIPTMYKAYEENFSIYFYKSYTDEENNTPLNLYKYIDPNGNVEERNYIDLEKEVYSVEENPKDHLNKILGPKTGAGRYEAQILDEYASDGLYEYLKNKKFEEKLGEYYQQDASEGMETDAIEANKTKKRVITYVLQ